MDQGSEGLANLISISQEPDGSVPVDINLLVLAHVYRADLTIVMVMH